MTDVAMQNPESRGVTVPGRSVSRPLLCRRGIINGVQFHPQPDLTVTRTDR